MINNLPKVKGRWVSGYTELQVPAEKRETASANDVAMNFMTAQVKKQMRRAVYS
jgi:hypothetical protein